MKKNATKILLGFLFLLIIAGVGYWAQTGPDRSQALVSAAKNVQEKVGRLSENNEEEGEENEVKTKKARQAYFFRLLRDPATNSIPKNIRSRELNHARKMPTLLQVTRQMKATNPTMKVAEGFNWLLAGPQAVGGRTRALGIDRRNSDIIIAGGVSGGIWKSTDGGDSWALKTPDFDSFSVTSLSQDPTHPDTWYYSAGELVGNSASGRDRSASYYGTGIFRSTNNGDTWKRIAGTEDDDTQFDSQFDFVHRITVSPTTGTVFVASNGFGVFRSPNGNNYNNLVLGGPGEHEFADVTAASDGTVAAVLSSADAGTSGGDSGIFISTDDGKSWSDVTPSSFPTDYYRSVLAFAPSDPTILYVFTSPDSPFIANPPGNSDESPVFYKLNLATGTSQDRSDNLPDFGDPVGYTATQTSYDMTIAVKPDDPNFVTIGGINLFRSTDGFATPPADSSNAGKNKFWIGGYAKANNISQYPNQHADQQVQVYDPNNPNRLWAGTDGGVYVTNNVEANSVSWNDQNDGYIVTQFYDASIGVEKGDTRFAGGTQDNGTPFFQFDEQQNTNNEAADISSGDGGFSFFTKNFIYVSNAQGNSGNSRLIRFNGDLSGSFAFVQPSQAQTAFFINPYVVDPNDEGIMYYPGGSSLFRNTEVDKITGQNDDGATQGWKDLSSADLSNPFAISALAVTTVPANILYYAGSDISQSGTGIPVIKRLNNASSSNNEPTDISIPNAPGGAFVHDIAINPANGNDVLVVMSNYDIVGLYHTNDGGNSWQAVEGNLTGMNDPTSPNPGPSIRSATIVSSTSGPIYILGTSTGVYATQSLNGDNTQWGHESPFNNDGTADIGFSVVENITSRFSDGDVAVGTHGRGMFVGRFQGTVSLPDNPRITINPTEGQAGDEVTITAINFSFSTTVSENKVFFGDVQAKVEEASSSQLTVIVPRNTLAPDAENRSVQVSVKNTNGINPSSISFKIVPPNKNELKQNFPNPFSINENTQIPISLQFKSNVTIQVYNMSGQRVNQPIKNKSYQAGTYNIPLDFSGKASGIYIYRIIAEPTGSSQDMFVDSKKFTFIK